MKNQKIYDGIYSKGPSKDTDEFVMDELQTSAEKKLVKYYLLETIAHNEMLIKQNLIPKESGAKILKVLSDLLNGQHLEKIIDPKIGDVHENVEHILTEKLGEEAGWFHTARSRNDQICTDQKLYLKDNIKEIQKQLVGLIKVLVGKSENYKEIIMPGFTHMRVATPSTFGFWFQAHAIELLDSLKILNSIYKVIDKCPLGAGTSYGVNWAIDPEYTAKKLGFAKPFENALAEINSRGINEIYVVSALSGILTIISKMMEDLIIWSMPEIGFVGIGEEYTTGSSIMPQKMNPDIAEKLRSKVGKLAGDLVYLITVSKGTPSGYNRDSADTKLAVIDACEQTLSSLKIATKMLSGIIPNNEKMLGAVTMSLVTKLADTLSQKYQIPFRSAHKVAGHVTKITKGEFSAQGGSASGGNIPAFAEALAGKQPSKLEKIIEEITGMEVKIDKSFLKDIFDVNKALDQYTYPGTPSPKYVSQLNKEILAKLTNLIK